MKILDKTWKQVETIKFPAGETSPKGIEQFNDLKTVKLLFEWKNGNDELILLMQVVDALSRAAITKREIVLYMPYFPYGRQDRVCNRGESLSSKVVANLINGLNIDSVITIDNHSDVSTALIDRCINMSVDEFLSMVDFNVDYYDSIVAPDLGSTKKISKFHRPFIQCKKTRDIKTGNLSGFEVLDKAPVKMAKNLLIIDDICDGGGTFIGIGKKLKEINKDVKLDLYITHGFFTKGVDDLLKIYDNIFTTSSVCSIKNDKVNVIHLFTTI